MQAGVVAVVARTGFDFAEFLDELQLLRVLLLDPVALQLGGVVQIDPHRIGRQLGPQVDEFAGEPGRGGLAVTEVRC